jgi:hypothetical protein
MKIGKLDQYKFFFHMYWKSTLILSGAIITLSALIVLTVEKSIYDSEVIPVTITDITIKNTYTGNQYTVFFKNDDISDYATAISVEGLSIGCDIEIQKQTSKILKRNRFALMHGHDYESDCSKSKQSH